MPHPAPSRDAPPRSRSPDWQRRQEPSHDGRGADDLSRQKGSTLDAHLVRHLNPFSHPRSRRRDGAFMDPAGATGGNRWQMRDPQKTAQTSRSATHGNRFGAHGKEGVSGSSPEEGSAKAPHVDAFPLPGNLILVEHAAGMEPCMEPSGGGHPCRPMFRCSGGGLGGQRVGARQPRFDQR
jgi:hypothetical protein